MTHLRSLRPIVCYYVPCRRVFFFFLIDRGLQLSRIQLLRTRHSTLEKWKQHCRNTGGGGILNIVEWGLHHQCPKKGIDKTEGGCFTHIVPPQSTTLIFCLLSKIHLVQRTVSITSMVLYFNLRFRSIQSKVLITIKFTTRTEYLLRRYMRYIKRCIRWFKGT